MTGDDLPPRLTKEQIEKRVYAIRRKKYLGEHPICEACKVEPAVIIHHKITRKTHLTDESVFMACCRPCEHQFHVKEKQAKEPQMLRAFTFGGKKTTKPRHCCQFKSRTIGKVGSCWGELERKNVFKSGRLVAIYWLCSRHRDMLLFGGNTLENVGSDREQRELKDKVFWEKRRTETGPYKGVANPH